MSLQTAKEVGLLDGLPSGIACTLDNLRALLEAFGGIGHGIR